MTTQRERGYKLHVSQEDNLRCIRFCFVACVAVFLSSVSVSAAPISAFAVAGTGQICTPLPGPALEDCTTGLTMTGIVTLELIGAPDGAGPNSAGGANWIASTFQLQWTGAVTGTYTSAHVANETLFTYFASTLNDYPDPPPQPRDSLSFSFESANISSTGPFRVVTNRAQLDRYTTDASWLSDLSFPFNAGLAPNALLNEVSFFDWDLTYGDQGVTAVGPGSRRGSFTLTAMTEIPPAAVPEPASLLLLGAGLAGLAVHRSRRTRR